jgi:hypothetical protein
MQNGLQKPEKSPHKKPQTNAIRKLRLFPGTKEAEPVVQKISKNFHLRLGTLIYKMFGVALNARV